MGAYGSKKLLKCFSYGIRYLNRPQRDPHFWGTIALPRWQKAQINLSVRKDYETAKRLMPTTSSFFNLLRSVKERYPQLSQQQVVMIGSHVWNQLTWPEKKPFYVAAWKQQFKRDIQRRNTHVFNRNPLMERVELPQKRYNLRSGSRKPANPAPENPVKELEERPKVQRRPRTNMSRFITPTSESHSRLYVPIRRNALSLVNNLLENSHEEDLRRLKTILAAN